MAMIHWRSDDKLRVRSGFLVTACCIDGSTNEGNNERSFRRMWEEEQWEHLRRSTVIV